MSAFEIKPGDRVFFEGRKHTVDSVQLDGPSAPYGRLRCDDHSSDYCPAKHGKITWHVLEWVEPRDEQTVHILLKGQDVGGHE